MGRRVGKKIAQAQWLRGLTEGLAGDLAANGHPREVSRTKNETLRVERVARRGGHHKPKGER
jgi:hypothetical protein